MSEWLASGRVVDLILVALLLECALLAWLARLGYLNWLSWLPNIAAGGALLVALRLVLTDATWAWIAAALGFALLAHVIDLRHRIRTE